IHFHPWNIASFSRDITASDVAIIPIDPSNAFAMGKPENKLIMLWKLGMPVVTSATPAYERAMRGAGLDQLCASESDWKQRIEELLNASAEDLECVGRAGRTFAQAAYSKQRFVEAFDETFASIGFQV